MTWNKPLPTPTDCSKPFWEGLKAHDLRIQRCADNGHWIFYPRVHCPVCGSRNLEWRSISGNGRLHTYSVSRVPTMPEFVDEMPQILAVVELDEGPHINTTIIGADPSELRIDQRVRPVFDDRPGEFTLLRYTPEESTYPGVISADADAEPQPEPIAAPAVAKRQIDVKDLEGLKSLISQEYTAWSAPYMITQELIDQFAELSGDDYWIHTDPERARKESPFGGTIAHGTLVQVLISRLRIENDYEVTGFRNMVNYGSQKLRFMAPVPAGTKIHARSRITEVEETKRGVKMVIEISVHNVGQERPSVVNELVVLYM